MTTHGVILTHALYWVEDGVHVVRSREFDLIGEGEDRESAIEMLAGNAHDLVIFLGELIRAGDATPYELETFTTLGARWVEMYERHENEMRGRLLPWRRREEAHHGGDWQSGLETSSQLLPA